MTKEELIRIANTAYGENLVIGYFQEPEDELGDTLALFIMRELSETFDDIEDVKESQLNEAIRVMTNARDEIERVISALEGA